MLGYRRFSVTLSIKLNNATMKCDIKCGALKILFHKTPLPKGILLDQNLDVQTYLKVAALYIMHFE